MAASWRLSKKLRLSSSVPHSALQDHYEAVKAKLIPAVQELKSGDPKDEDVFVGPLISEKEAKRIEEWIQEALSRGEERPFSGVSLGTVASCEQSLEHE